MREFDVLVIGAGLPGISAAWHVKTECPQLHRAVPEPNLASTLRSTNA